MASSVSIPTKVAPKRHVTVRVWCVRRCAIKRGRTDLLGNTSAGNSASPTQCVECHEDVFQAEDPFLISIADVSRTHFYADAVRDVCVRFPDEDPKARLCVGSCERQCTDLLDAAQRRSSFGDWRIFPRRGISVSFLPQGPFWCTNDHEGRNAE